MALLMGPRMTAVTPVSTSSTPLPAFQFSSRPRKAEQFFLPTPHYCVELSSCSRPMCFCRAAQRCGVRKERKKEKKDYPLPSWGIYPSGNKPVTSPSSISNLQASTSPHFSVFPANLSSQMAAPVRSHQFIFLSVAKESGPGNSGLSGERGVLLA